MEHFFRQLFECQVHDFLKVTEMVGHTPHSLCPTTHSHPTSSSDRVNWPLRCDDDISYNFLLQT